VKKIPGSWVKVQNIQNTERLSWDSCSLLEISI